MKLLSKIWALIFIVFALVMTPTQSIYAGNLDSAGGGVNGFWECWDDGSMDPCHHTLNKVYSITENEAWAVGDYGTILHWNGVEWEQIASPTSDNIMSLDFLSPLDGWAAGGNLSSTILHWNGTQWSPLTIPDIGHLEDIDILSPIDGWAVGWSGEIMHWDGANWIKSAITLDDYLIGVEMVSSNDVWVLGQQNIYHWDGAAWSKDTSLSTKGWLMDMDMLSASDGWIAGEFGNIFHWNGSQWLVSREGTSNGNLTEIYMETPAKGWAVGVGGLIYSWNGSEWSTISSYSWSNADLFSVSMAGGKGWIVGAGGVSLQYSGTAWPLVPAKRSLLDVEFYSVNDGWAVGSGGRILHWDGNSWSSVSSPVTGQLNSIAVVSPEKAWIAAGSDLLQWDGMSWSAFATKPYHPIQVVDAVENNVWVSGGYALCSPSCIDLMGFISSWNGTTWSTRTTNHIYIEQISMANQNLGFAGGDYWTNENPYPTLFQWDGSTWSEVSWFLYPVNDIAAVSSDNAWIVAFDWTTGSKVFHWNGATYNEVQIPTDINPGSIDVSPEGEVWLAGKMMLHRTGSSWDQFPIPTGNYIYALDIVSVDKGWAVGQNGVILEYKVPTLSINYPDGSPGSYFNLTGTDFPRNQTATVTVNGQALGTVQVGEDGSFVFTLSTDGADEGIYYVTVSVNPSATVKLTLDNSDPLRDKVGTYLTLAIPAGIGFDNEVYLPVIKR